MKNLVVIGILFFISFFSLKGQKIRFYGGVDYYSKNYVRLRDKLPIGGKVYDISLIHKGGRYGITTGAEYNPYPSLYIHTTVHTEVNTISLVKWAPIQSEYTIGAKYKYKTFVFAFEHVCSHPVDVYNYKESATEMHSGHSKFSITFSTK